MFFKNHNKKNIFIGSRSVEITTIDFLLPFYQRNSIHVDPRIQKKNDERWFFKKKLMKDGFKNDERWFKKN